jgi:competence protein ComGC
MIILFLIISVFFIPIVSATDDDEFNKTAVEGINKTMEIKNQLNSYVSMGDTMDASMKAGNLRMNGQFYEMQLDRYETSPRLADYVEAIYNYFHGTYLYGYWYEKYINEINSLASVSIEDQENYLDKATKSFDIAHTNLNETYPQPEPTPGKMKAASYDSFGYDPFMMRNSAIEP